MPNKNGAVSGIDKATQSRRRYELHTIGVFKQYNVETGLMHIRKLLFEYANYKSNFVAFSCNI